MAYLAALAIFVQCLFVQTHVDIPSRAYPAIVSLASGGEAHPRDAVSNTYRDGAPATGECVICREAALVSGAVPATAPVPELLVRRPVATAAVSYANPASIRFSHAWRSRAPPVLI